LCLMLVKIDLSIVILGSFVESEHDT
jgi:hypothetical protein